MRFGYFGVLITLPIVFIAYAGISDNRVSDPINYEKLESGALRAHWTHDGADIIYEHKIDDTDELSVPVGDVAKGDIRPNVVYVLRKDGSMTRNGELFSDKNFQTYDARDKLFRIMAHARMVHPESFK